VHPASRQASGGEGLDEDCKLDGGGHGDAAHHGGALTPDGKLAAMIFMPANPPAGP
jgi:hypothetical protein